MRKSSPRSGGSSPKTVPTTAQAALGATDSWPMAAESDEVEEDVLVLTERVPMNGQTFLHAEPHAEGPAEIVQTQEPAEAAPD